MHRFQGLGQPDSGLIRIWVWSIMRLGLTNTEIQLDSPTTNWQPNSTQMTSLLLFHLSPHTSHPYQPGWSAGDKLCPTTVLRTMDIQAGFQARDRFSLPCCKHLYFCSQFWPFTMEVYGISLSFGANLKNIFEEQHLFSPVLPFFFSLSSWWLLLDLKSLLLQTGPTIPYRLNNHLQCRLLKKLRQVGSRHPNP